MFCEALRLFLKEHAFFEYVELTVYVVVDLCIIFVLLQHISTLEERASETTAVIMEL
jgi:hypothetical protein